MIEINPLDDIMLNFELVFFVYVILFIVVCMNFYKAIQINKNLSDSNPTVKSVLIFDLYIDIFCGVAMGAGIMFQAVLADNNALNWDVWFKRLIIVSILSLVVFILNVFVVFKKEKTNK